MRVLLSGSSGLIGGALAQWLQQSGRQVIRLVRSSAPAAPDVRSWDPASDRLEPQQLADVDAVVHLGGESLAAGEMADEMLLASTRAVPRRLQESGYRFAHPDLEPLLRDILG